MSKDEHFIPSEGLDLETYIARGDRMGAHHLVRYLWAVACLAERPGLRTLLDLGCGAGYGSYLIASSRPDVRVVGVDYDPEAIEAARAAYSLANLEFFGGDATRWEATVGDDVFDCVVSFDSIEHVAHRELFMEGIVEHLGESGFLMLSTPVAWPANLLEPAWEAHKIEYGRASLYDLLSRYFRAILRPEDGSLPHVEIFERLRGTGIDYLLELNPVICEHPIRVPNPYRRFLSGGAGARARGLCVFAGDWTRAGVDTPGTFDAKTGIVALVHPHGSAPAATVFEAPVRGPRWTAVAGDWDGDGVDTVALCDVRAGRALLLDGNHAGAVSREIAFDARGAEWAPVAGDWTGEGRDTLGLFDARTRTWRIPGRAESFVFGPVRPDLLPLAGDWRGEGRDAPGVYSSESADFHLSVSSEPGGEILVNFGIPGCLPLTGDWDGDGTDTIGICNVADGFFYLRNSHSPGDAEVAFAIPAGRERHG